MTFFPTIFTRKTFHQKDLELERSVGKWLEMVAGKKGKDESFERWIQDGTVLAKVFVFSSYNISFNL